MSRRHPSQHPDPDQNAMRCVVDAAGELVFVSPSLSWALGQSAAGLAGKPLKSIIEITSPGGGAESGYYEVALLRRERDPLLTHARIDRVDGPDNRRFTVIWLDPDGKLKGRDAGQAARDFAVLIGDTQRAGREEGPPVTSIATTDGELRHFLNLSNDLLGVCRPDMVFLRVNPAFSRALGFSEEDLKKFPFTDLLHPDDRERALAEMKKTMAAPPDEIVRADFECRVQRRDGAFRRVEWIHKAAGGHVYIVGRDVTEIRRQEEELRRREEQLSEAQKIGHMGHWYWNIANDPDLKGAMEWSDQIYAIFGVDKEVFRPYVDNIRARVLKRDLARIYRAFQRAVVRKKDYAFEFRLRRPGGTIRYIRCEGQCKMNAKTGRVDAFFGIMQDITDRTLHERALRAAKEAAEEAYASKTRFLANMSHELRTPLNAIIGFSEMMQRQLLGPIGNTRYAEYIGGIRESGEHLLDLINDILDMSKIEAGKYELHPEDVNVGKVIRLAVHMVEGHAHEGQVRLVTDGIADDVQVHADRRALMQVLLNILSNAVKFTRAGGTVEARCQYEPGGAVIVVSDTGIGIPREKLGIVTKPFEQVDSEFTRRHEGSGLGLAITKDLIELHGGTLDIDSEAGVGTTVTVFLPERIRPAPASLLPGSA